MCANVLMRHIQTGFRPEQTNFWKEALAALRREPNLGREGGGPLHEESFYD